MNQSVVVWSWSHVSLVSFLCFCSLVPVTSALFLVLTYGMEVDYEGVNT